MRYRVGYLVLLKEQTVPKLEQHHPYKKSTKSFENYHRWFYYWKFHLHLRQRIWEEMCFIVPSSVLRIDAVILSGVFLFSCWNL